MLSLPFSLVIDQTGLTVCDHAGGADLVAAGGAENAGLLRVPDAQDRAPGPVVVHDGGAVQRVPDDAEPR